MDHRVGRSSTLLPVSYTHLDVYKRQPLIGANVVEKGRSTNGVITDFNGKFTLEVDESASLVVSYIGSVSYTHLDVYKRQY